MLEVLEVGVKRDSVLECCTRVGVLECWSVGVGVSSVRERTVKRDSVLTVLGVYVSWTVKSVGVLECWKLECWSVGVLECWSVGVLECWRGQ